jgi:hypothetical protein
MGEARKDALRLDFDRRLRLEFRGTKITSDAGLLAYRELDEALGLTSTIDSEVRDVRTGKNTQHSISALLRQSIYSRLAGYDDTNDAERLAVDPAMRHVAGGRCRWQSGGTFRRLYQCHEPIRDRDSDPTEESGVLDESARSMGGPSPQERTPKADHP